MKRGHQMYRRSIAAAVLLAIPLAACNATTSPKQDSVVTNSPATSAQVAQTSPTTAPATVGTTLTTGSTNITLTQIIDPASPANEYLTAGPGKRLVGVKFTIANVGKTVLHDDINADAAVQGSDGQTYTPSLADIAGCTNFNNGTFTITPGQVQSGCAAFALPSGVTVTQVQVTLISSGSNEVGQWKV